MIFPQAQMSCGYQEPVVRPNILPSPGDLTAVPPWIHARITVAAAPDVAGPGGVFGGVFKIEETAVSGSHQPQQNIVPIPDTWYTWSAALKAAERFEIRLQISNFANLVSPATIGADLSTGEVLYMTEGSSRIDPLGDGWYRLAIWVQTVSAPPGNIAPVVNTLDPAGIGGVSFMGEAGKGFYMANPKLEIGKWPTPYFFGAAVYLAAEVTP
jgi:hypothetical protein